VGVVDRSASDHLVDHEEVFGTPREPPITDPDVERQIASYRRPGFKDPRQKEIERRMRDYMAGRTTKF